MELVKGLPITEYCNKAELSTIERLQLFTQVCSAVQHAHQRGVIHRDLKPSNVLVSTHEGKPIAKVIDFGVAKAMNQKLTEKTLFTAYGHMIGTPQYMSPEQAELSILDVDTRTDVYSLGVLLYEILTGTTPVRKDSFAAAAFDEMRRMIREVDPERPSQRLSTLGEAAIEVARSQGFQPDSLQKYIRGDLDWIILKALEKDRSRRYESPKSLAEDIGRFLETRPIEARRPSLTYRSSKLLKRNSSRLVIAGLLLLVACSTWGASHLLRQREPAPPDSRQLYTLGKAQKDAGEFGAAEATLKAAQEQAIAAVEHGTQEQVKASILPQISNTLAWTLFSQNKYREAIDNTQQLENWVQQYPEHEELLKSLKQQAVWVRHAAALYSCVLGADSETLRKSRKTAAQEDDVALQALAALRLGELDLADKLVTGCDQFARNGFYHLVTSEILRQRGEKDLAKSMFLIANQQLSTCGWMLELDDGWPEFYRLLHEFADEIRPHFQEPLMPLNLEDLAALAERLPNYSEAQVRLGRALVKSGRLNEASDTFLRAVDLGEPRGIWLAGLIALKEGNQQLFEQCKELCLKQLQKTTSDWHVTNPECIAFLTLNPECEVAQDWINKLKRIDNRDPIDAARGAFPTAMCAARLEDWDLASRGLSRLDRLDTETASALLALIELRKGNYASAREHCQRAEEFIEKIERPLITGITVKENRITALILLREVRRELDAISNTQVQEVAFR